MNRYRLTPEAANDLDEITDFIAADNPQAAARLIDSLQEKCQALAEMPGIGRSREELALNLRSGMRPLIPANAPGRFFRAPPRPTHRPAATPRTEPIPPTRPTGRSTAIRG